MDVRCDRCQTEYELDDESVTDAGASVQCTTCGHTFVVSRSGATVVGMVTPGSEQDDFTSPSSPDWALATEDGQTHRFRDLMTLQKWVVERRVTRQDRVSQRGGPWRRLAEVAELRPFFEVVEQADRARVGETARTGRATAPSTPRRPPNVGRAHVSSDVDDDDVFATAGNSRSGARRANELIDSTFDGDGDGDADLLAAGLSRRRRGAKIAGGVVILGLAGVAAYLGFKDPHGFKLAHDGEVPAPPATAPARPAASAVPAPALSAPAAPAPAPGPPPAVAAVPSAAPPAARPLGAPVAAAPVAAVPAPPPAAPAPAPADEPGRGAEAAAARPKTYERLVADADHALENGQSGKAQKLYDEALRLQPDGVAAVTGSAYLLLDRQRPLAAIGLFKRALGNAPSFPPALFGLGEAYRAQGDGAHAVEAYQKYLAVAPGGADAPAARRQVRDLGEAAAAPPRRGPSAAPSGESAKVEPPPASPVPDQPPP